MNIPCIKCKGADPINACGRTFCPIIAKSEAMFKVKKLIDREDFFGSSPTPFVGHNFYPNLYVGILSPPEQRDDAWLFDAPNYWSEKNFQIPEIIDYRSSLINSRFRANIKDVNKLVEIGQEIGMASKPVDVEINLKDKPKFKLNTDSYIAPMGPNARLEKAKITENPKIDSRVEKTFSDSDLKANNAMIYLYEKGFSENFLTKILSIGTLGVKKDRKLVPTRWSISSVDSNIGNYLLKNVKDYNQTGYLAYFGGYLGNYFLILCFPEIYSYELFETYMPKASWNVDDRMSYTTDYEPYEGRKYYASNCGGGFYATRIALLEKLNQIKRQASVLVIRVITGEYYMPLGVFVVREATRKALSRKPLEFSSKELMLVYSRKLVKKKFGIDIEFIFKNSKLLDNLKNQRKINEFI